VLEQAENEILRPSNKQAFFNILILKCRILPQSFSKILIGPPKNIFEKIKMGIKNAKFVAEYKTVGKSKKCSPTKSMTQKTKTTICKSRKVHV